MPVVGVASKLRPPSAVGTKPVHTALPIPSAVRATSQGFMAQQQELRASEGDPRLSCQLSIKSEFQQERKPDGKSRAKTEESRICKVSGERRRSVLRMLHRCEFFQTNPARCQQVSDWLCKTRALTHVSYGGMMLQFVHHQLQREGDESPSTVGVLPHAKAVSNWRVRVC